MDKEKGITLIALVITVIILLILSPKMLLSEHITFWFSLLCISVHSGSHG